jgi:small GTP-binding protein
MSHLPSFKILFVGDRGVGKTSIIAPYENNPRPEIYVPTITPKFVDIRIEVPGQGNASLQLWDTSGHWRYESLDPVYARGVDIAIVVFDVSDRESFETIDDWVARVQTDVGPNCKVVVAANKIDLEHAIPEDEIDKWRDQREIEVFYVSAKTRANIDDMFGKILENLPRAKFELSRQDHVTLQRTTRRKRSRC